MLREHPRLRAETRHFGVQARTMKITNSPPPPWGGRTEVGV
jgi:hypothetical protein